MGGGGGGGCRGYSGLVGPENPGEVQAGLRREWNEGVRFVEAYGVLNTFSELEMCLQWRMFCS